MAYNSRVYRVLIASPNDVEEERDIAVRVIQEWNDLHSHSRKVVLLPLRWETHTAPEYGTRPQEVINRTIVDQCDLLVGIFWTRIGSRTGEADSGTLEEIERAGNASKPIMLYFSRNPIDPELLDLDQVERLNSFKQKTYPQSLIESYKSIIEFRDKFAKQLELKVRDLQTADDSGLPPLSLSFLSLETLEVVDGKLSKTVTVPEVTDLDSVVTCEPDKSRKDTIQNLIDQQITESASVPIVLVIRNASSSGIRNLFVKRMFDQTQRRPRYQSQ